MAFSDVPKTIVDAFRTDAGRREAIRAVANMAIASCRPTGNACEYDDAISRCMFDAESMRSDTPSSSVHWLEDVNRVPFSGPTESVCCSTDEYEYVVSMDVAPPEPTTALRAATPPVVL